MSDSDSTDTDSSDSSDSSDNECECDAVGVTYITTYDLNKLKKSIEHLTKLDMLNEEHIRVQRQIKIKLQEKINKQQEEIKKLNKENAKLIN